MKIKLATNFLIWGLTVYVIRYFTLNDYVSEIVLLESPTKVKNNYGSSNGVYLISCYTLSKSHFCFLGQYA